MIKDQLLKEPLYTLNEEQKDICKKLETAQRQDIFQLKHGSKQQFVENKKVCQQISSKKQEVRDFLFSLNNLTQIKFRIKSQ